MTDARTAALEEVERRLRALSGEAYVRACDMAKAPLCLGEEHKIKTGQFTLANLKAIEAVQVQFGKHSAYADAANAIRALSTPPSVGAEVLAALKQIAEQKTLAELSDEGQDNEGDFEGAYDTMIELARKAIAAASRIPTEKT